MNLNEYFKQQKDAFGPWVATAETRNVMRMQLAPQQSYRRATTNPNVAGAWRDAHERGQIIREMFRNRDAGGLLRISTDRFGLGGLARSGTLNRLRDMMLSITDREGQPMIFHCPACERDRLAEGRVATAEPGVFVCNECGVRRASRTLRYSTVMGGYILASRAYVAYTSRANADRQIQDHVTLTYLREHGYTEYEYVYYAPGAYDPLQRLNTTLYGYHSGPDMSHIPSAYDNRKPRVLAGVELEMEIVGDCDSCDSDDDDEDRCSDRSDYAKRVLRTLNGVTPGFCKAETDGSLDNGFEIITGYTGLDVHAKTWAVLERATDGLESHDTTTCGLHVHLDKAGMTPLHAAKLCTFIHSPENRALMTTVARRYATGSGGYAKFYHDEDWISRTSHARSVYNDHRTWRKKGEKFDYGRFATDDFFEERYAALNFNNKHTVEFRLFRGTLKYESIMACIEFAFAAWHFSKEAPMHKLTTEEFMKFICRADNRQDTRFLRAYLKAKKFRSFYQAEQVARPKFKAEVPTTTQQNNMLHNDAGHVEMRERQSHRPVSAAA